MTEEEKTELWIELYAEYLDKQFFAIENKKAVKGIARSTARNFPLGGGRDFSLILNESELRNKIIHNDKK